jgi:hypothetical protein
MKKVEEWRPWWWLQLLGTIVERFRGGLVFKTRIFSYHSTLGSGAIKKNKKVAVGRTESTYVHAVNLSVLTYVHAVNL